MSASLRKVLGKSETPSSRIPYRLFHTAFHDFVEFIFGSQYFKHRHEAGHIFGLGPKLDFLFFVLILAQCRKSHFPKK